MSLARLAVHRPIFTLMGVLMVLIVGSIALSRLPIDLMPDVTNPTISVGVSYGSASPEEMEELVTRPLEEALSSVPRAQEVSSTSIEGRSNVRVLFTWGTDLDEAANDIRDRLDRIAGLLPADATRPALRKWDPAANPIMILGASSRMEPVQARKMVEQQVKYRLERVPGVASLDIQGGLLREIHVTVNTDKIKALGLSLEAILSRLGAENVNLPAGQIERGNFEVTLRTPGEYGNLEEIRETTVALRDGVPIRVREVATVEDTHKRVLSLTRFNGVPGMRLAVYKQSGENTVRVADAVKEEIRRINLDMPHVQLTALYDTSDFIKRAITGVSVSARDGGLLAILVLLFFLRNIRSTFITATAIPLSIIATFALMYFNGFTLNIMTMGGLALGIGRLVDDAIVVLENIYRLREGGQGATESAVNGTVEVTSAIIASTLTTVVVFMPLAFVRGMVGVMFKQFAFVVGFSLLCSLGVAQTLVPMLSARILTGSASTSAHPSLGRRLFLFTGRFFAAMEDGYRSILHAALRTRLVVVAAALVLLAGSLLLIPKVGVELAPRGDESDLWIGAEMDVSSRLEVVDATARRIEAIAMAEVPEATTVIADVGVSSAWMRLPLKPREQRTRTCEQIAAALRERLSGIPGATVRVNPGGNMTSMMIGGVASTAVQLDIRGYDLSVADALAARIRPLVEAVPGVTDVTVSRRAGAPEELVVIDRKKAADMKLSVSQIARMLQTVLSGSQACTFREGGDEYIVLVKAREAEHLALAEIMDLTITNSDGDPVVLRNVASLRKREGPVRIDRKNQQRYVSVTSNVAGRDMNAVVEDIRLVLAQVPVPEEFSVVFGGAYDEQQQAFVELKMSLVLALAMVYIVMACLYESLLDPFVIMFSVPMAAIGVIVMLFLTSTTLNMQSYIGCIMLGGIVVSNAILIVDHTNLLRQRDGMPMREAIVEAGRRRLRPILMTSLATILGLVPLALGLGEGGEMQAPMARAVIGGLISSTVITLVFVPVVYSLLERFRHRKSSVSSSKEPASNPV